MKIPFDLNSPWFIGLVILYRSIYGVIGSYTTAALAPNRPLRHAMIGGFIGLIISIIGAVTMKDEGPAWYAISLIILALPTAWIGGILKK